jgi:hypothetical protein
VIFFRKSLLRKIYILRSTVARSYGSGVLAANLAACVRERERLTFGETDMWIFVHSVDITTVLGTWLTQ